jgi:hypothetical protein
MEELSPNIRSADHRLVLLVEIHVLVIGFVEVQPVEDDEGLRLVGRAGNRNVDIVAEGDGPEIFRAPGRHQVDADPAAGDGQAVKAVGIALVLDIHAIAARCAGIDIIPPELAVKAERRKRIAGWKRVIMVCARNRALGYRYPRTNP